MSNRRQFLAGISFLGAFALRSSHAEGAGRRRRRSMCCGPCDSQFVQPDSAAWAAATREGLTEAEVLQILGEPIEREHPPVRPEHMSQEEWDSVPASERQWYQDVILADTCYGWRYGRLDFRSPSVPITYDFVIYFRRGRVMMWSSPFDPPLSRSGVPTAPTPLLPMNQVVFDSRVDVLDFRWGPPAGLYPMTFTLEFVGGYDTNIEGEDGELTPKREWFDPERLVSGVPHLAVPNPGFEHWRWRLKAHNTLGEGPWSTWQSFRVSA